MNHLTLYPMGDWICFKSNNNQFLSCLKSGLLPASYRKYDVDTCSWLVWHTKIKDLVAIAYSFYEVDTSKLPDEWTRGTEQAPSPVQDSPYAELYLLDKAPFTVVKAAYKALLLVHHPDHNDGVGDQVKLNKVIAAYREIESKL